MLFNWNAGVEGDMNDKENHGEENYIEVEENTNEINQNHINDQDSNYDSIPHNVPHSRKKTYINAVNDLQDIDDENELNHEENLIDEEELSNSNELNSLNEICKNDKKTFMT